MSARMIVLWQDQRKYQTIIQQSRYTSIYNTQGPSNVLHRDRIFSRFLASLIGDLGPLFISEVARSRKQKEIVLIRTPRKHSDLVIPSRLKRLANVTSCSRTTCEYRRKRSRYCRSSAGPRKSTLFLQVFPTLAFLLVSTCNNSSTCRLLRLTLMDTWTRIPWSSRRRRAR